METSQPGAVTTKDPHMKESVMIAAIGKWSSNKIWCLQIGIPDMISLVTAPPVFHWMKYLTPSHTTII